MVTIKVGNSISILKNFTAQQMRELRKIVAYQDFKGAPRRFAKLGVRKALIDKRGYFPTGLLFLIEWYYSNKGVACRLDDQRVRPVAPLTSRSMANPRSYEPYPEQFAAAEAAYNHSRGIIVAPTGVGKSVIAELIIDRLQVKTLIVVPSLELKKQLTAGFQQSFGQLLVGPLDDGYAEKFITIENVDQLEKVKGKIGVDCVIIDEFHRSAANTYRQLNYKQWNDVYFKFGLTATPFRSQDSERLLLQSVLSKVIYKIEYQEAVKRGYIVPMEVYYVELPAIDRIKGETYQEVYDELIRRQDKNEIVADMIANLHESGVSTLALTRLVDHGKDLQGALKARGFDIPFAEGSNGLNRELIGAFNARLQLSLLGTSGVLGEGIDTKPAEYVALCGGGKSKPAFMQNLGRGFRKFGDKKSCKIILFRDPSHPWLEEHFLTQCRYLKEEYGIRPVKLAL